jgi:hypothetical protein
LAHLEELFKRLHEVNVKIHPKKCEFVVTSIVYLAHIILPNGIMAHWAKVVAILEMPNPIDVHTLRSFIKLCNYYRIYVQDLSTIAHPLYALLKKDVVWTWSEEVQETFDTLKEKLLEFPILRRPDFSKVFILHIVSQPHFEASVKMKFTLPKVGTWSPARLSKTQSLIAGVKTPCIKVFFISLERC